MKFLSHSNGLHTVAKEKIKPMNVFKRCAIIVVSIFALGFLVQMITNIVDNSVLKSNFKYGRIDGNKLEYRLNGTGSYTVVFDGDIGANLYQWENICETLESQGKVATFSYNRLGYGFNDSKELSPEDQAKTLKSLLKKAGASEPYILVGEEYGSLVLTNFAKLYPESVAGVVLVSPIEESKLVEEETQKILKGKYYRSKFEEFGCNFSLTRVLSKMNLTMENTSFKNNLNEDELEEFLKFENKKNYRNAVSSEIENLYNNSSESQTEGLLGDKPLYIITEDADTKLASLSSGKYVQVFTKENIEAPFSMTDTENTIITGINNVYKQAEKMNNKNK